MKNPICKRMGKCQPFCGLCNLRGKGRVITKDSLFGVCRLTGRCVCKNWSDTDNCNYINGRKASPIRKKAHGDYAVSEYEINILSFKKG